MTVNYQVEIIGHSGNRKYLIPDIAGGSFTCRVNDIGDYSLDLLTNDQNFPFSRDDVVRFGRNDSLRDGFSAFTSRFDGLHLFEDFAERSGPNGDPLTNYSSGGFDTMDILARPVVNYLEGTSQAKKSLDVFEAIYQYVNENLGPGAVTGNGRAFDMAFDPLTINVPTDTLAIYRGDNARQELIDTIQRISSFALEETGMPVRCLIRYVGNYQFIFDVTTPLDLSATNINPNTGRNGAGFIPVILSLDHGTIIEMRRVTDYRKEANVITALGKGDDSGRRVITTANTQTAFTSPLARRERVISASRLDTDGEIRAESKEWITDLEARPLYYVEISDTTNQHLWYDYELGHLVSLYDRQRREFWKCWITAYRVDINVPADGQPVETINIELMALEQHD